MDPLTQATLGAAAAQAAARPKRFLAATLAGAAGGFLPDSDVLIRSSTDPLLSLEYHRHFTHSLAFIPIGGMLTAALCAKLSRGRASFRELVIPASLGWGTHGLLDSCTSYGTYLYWPFSNERVAWHVISIVDPLFTFPLLAGVIWAARKRLARITWAFLAYALLYIGLGTFQLHRAESVQADLIAKRGHEPVHTEVKPSLGNHILFRAFYDHEGRYYADAIRVPWWGEARIYEGDSIPAADVDSFVATYEVDEVRRNDIDRFAYFSAGYLVEDPRFEGVLSDFRYAAVPNDIAPMWGIDVLGTPPGQHLEWQHFRDFRPGDTARMLEMLWGRE